MSNDSVLVPLDLLNALKNGVVSRKPADGYVLAEATVLDGALQAVLDLIPAPPKVGDTITGQQFAALPALSVAIDLDGDVWVRTSGNMASTVQLESVYDSRVDITTFPDEYTANDFANGMLVHIGEEVI